MLKMRDGDREDASHGSTGGRHVAEGKRAERAESAGERAKAELVAELRRLKAASRLSFGRLADRTHYSRSSWERFLNGKQLPTPAAVEQLAAVAGEEAEPLLALLAEASAPTVPSVDRGPASEAAVEASEPEPEADLSGGDPQRLARRWRHRLTVLGYIAGGALMGSLVTGLVFEAGVSETGTGVAGPAATETGGGTVAAAGEVHVKCRSDTCIGRDPQAMDCQWDAVTARETWLRGMHIELRYSEACQSVWGRIENGAVGDTVKIKDRTELEQEARIRIDRDTYTKMLAVDAEAPPETVTICGAIPVQKQMECSPTQTVQP
ncbi:helix-turn-helix domain-containing protein [Streptomyces sp. ME18-1-4]|uniref:helix-turn-helix domain-containing protein n=1 Tax=Streptomyces sp. ME18-1-4 TaxID=3028685 RepID=UPI0029BE9236|nr:DUF2690 domain-containing protein [Streptomyces sp. ME18-1-4]MDX3246669.1 DUF2690 domain-containing protein [Streptomyces sp. ME18-1-4]